MNIIEMNTIEVEIDGGIYTIKNFGQEIWIYSNITEIVYFEDEIISGVLDAVDMGDGKLKAVKENFIKNLDKLRLALKKYKKLSSLI